MPFWYKEKMKNSDVYCTKTTAWSPRSQSDMSLQEFKEYKPSKTLLLWEHVKDSSKPHISKALLNKAKIVILSKDKYEHYQQVVKRISKEIVTWKKNNKSAKRIPWEKFKYNRAGLVAEGFEVIEEATIVAVPGLLQVQWKGKGDESIQIKANFIKYIYNPETVPASASAMDAYSKYLFGSGGAKKEKLGFGFYKMKASGERGGTKVEEGIMVMFGSRCTPTNVATLVEMGRGRTARRKVVGTYFGCGVDTVSGASRLAKRHWRELAQVERKMIPAYAEWRKALAKEVDPMCYHRLKSRGDNREEVASFAVSCAQHYVVSGHDDSGLGAEVIAFLNQNGPFPTPHEWLFVLGGGMIHPLPNARGQQVFLLIEKDVMHGTLPTSNVEATLPHGNCGSALFTKESLVKELRWESKNGEYKQQVRLLDSVQSDRVCERGLNGCFK